ncbi:hypothetical protein RRG08_003608 [Elysia crispata]|uniref:G-protein coupled receptors family 2 profile 2 domain-containing protein n=1 Tax=Elysia crispata TaxID=231223 RepID=A0AAE1E557_9GAST|nr:hypothetical protein RRG08_003608 [Elysia crispata]
MSVHNHTWNLKLPSLQSNISLTSIITERPKKNVLQRCDIGFWSSPIKESSPNISHPRHDFYMCFQEIVIHPRRFRGVASENTETKDIAYKEVKNTLNCPHFIYNLTNTTEAKLKNMNDNSEWPHSLEVLVHVSTGVELSTLYYTHTSEGLVMVCVDKIQEKMKLDYEEDRGGVDGVDVFGLGLVVTSHVCLGISIICLSLTLLTYCLLPSLRTLPGKNTMCLVASLLLAIVLFFVGGFVQESSLECQIIGMLTHFFILSTFVWMLICTIHMHRVFSDVLKHTQSGDGENNGKFIVYAVVSIVVSGVIVLVTVVANYIFTSFSDSNDSTTDYQLDNATDLTEIDSVHNSCETNSRVRFGYGNGICYLSNKLSLLLAGALPIVVSCAANLVIFTFTILAFRTMSLQEKVARKEKRGHLLIYIKLSTLTGV